MSHGSSLLLNNANTAAPHTLHTQTESYTTPKLCAGLKRLYAAFGLKPKLRAQRKTPYTVTAVDHDLGEHQELRPAKQPKTRHLNSFKVDFSKVLRSNERGSDSNKG
jgi:hypothetical protein